MATIKVGINVSDNGTTQKATQAAERLKQAYDAAGNSAQKINVPGSGGTGGGKSMAAAQTRAASSAELVEYNRQRAIAQNTGASARDFAKQSEGLGGLVRLYATFAANVFAVTAAFNALSRAMDTTNMIKGLDQLGAQSGMALGGLSKRFVDVTDGAISLRESVEAVAKASAAGLSSKQILQIGDNAKKASQALGVDMSDAVSRLTRGITKLEPELLDELGIYTKLEESVNKYALSVGKSASSLTDFERRQAFAVAVLDEANRKFGAIELDTNPYNKLLATFRDVTQSGLELINKVLSPLVGFLSQSPTILATAIAGLAAVLVKQAIPAIGQVRASLAATAEKSREIASTKAGDALQARKQLDSLLQSQIENAIEKQIDAVDAGEKKLQSIQKDSINRRGAVARLLSKDLDSITQKDIDRAEKRYERLSKDPNSATEAQASRQIIDGIKGQIKAENDLKVAKKEASDRLQKDMSNLTVFGAVQEASRKADEKAVKQSIVSNAAYNGSILGLSASMKLMNLQLDASGLKMTALGTAALYARAGMAAAAGAAVTLAAAVGNIFGIIGIVITGIMLLGGFIDSLFSKNSKQAEETSKSFDLVDDALKSVDATATALSKKDPLERLSAASITASARSVNELTTSISDLVEKVEAQNTSAGWWDKFVDGAKTVYGGDLLSKSSTRLANSVSKLLKTASGPEADKAIAKLKELVGVDPRDQEAFRKALSETPEKFLELAPKVAKETQNFSNGLTALAGSAQQASDDLNTASKSQSQFVTSALPSDKLSKFGSDLIKAGFSIKNALKDTNNELSVLQNLLKNPENVKLFSEEFQNYFTKNRDSISANLSVLSAYRAELQKLGNTRTPSVLSGIGAGFLAARGSFTGTTSTATTLKTEIQKIEEATVGKLREEANKMIEKGLKFLGKAAEDLTKRAADTINLAKIELLGNTEEAIRERTKIENEALQAQINSLELEKTLIGAQDKLQQSIELNTLAIKEQTAIQTASFDLQKPGASRGQIESALSKTIESIAKERQNILAPTADSRLSTAAINQITAQQRLLQSQQTANIFKQEGQLIDVRIRKQEEVLNLSIRQNEETIDRFELERSIAGVLSVQKQEELEAVKRNLLRLQQGKEQLQIDRDRQKIELVRKQPGVSLEQEEKRNDLLIKRAALQEALNNLREQDLKGPAKVDVDTSEVDRIRQRLAEKEKEKDSIKTGDTAKKLVEEYRKKTDELDTQIRKKEEDLDKFRKQKTIALEELGLEESKVKQRIRESIENESAIISSFPAQSIERYRVAVDTAASAEKLVKDQEKEIDNLVEKDRELRKQQAEGYNSLEQSLKRIDAEIKTLTEDLSKAESLQSLEVAVAQQRFAENTKNSITALQQQIEQTVPELEKVEKTIEEARSKKLGGTSLKDLERRQRQLRTQQELDIQKLNREAALRTAQNQIQLDEKARESINKLAALEKKGSDLVFEEKLERLKILEKLGIISAETQIKRQAELERKQEEKALSDRLNAINEERNKELAVLEDRQRTQQALGFEDTTLQPIINATTAAYGEIIAGEEAVSKARKEGINLLEQQNLLIESQNKLVQALEDAAAASTGAFKSLFTVFATLQKQEVDFTEKSTKLTRTKAAEQEQAGIDYYNNQEGLQNQLFLIDKKYNTLSAKLQAENIQKQMGATKGLFKEKTAAYKIFSGLEKAAAAQTLVLNLQSTLSNIGTLATTVTKGAANLFAQGGFAGFAGVGAMLAVLGSLGVFKKGTKVSTGPSVEDIQKAQLTGQSYQGNQLVTRRGALESDPTAKLESIDKSLELIQKASFDDLDFSNESTAYLQKIEKNTKGLSERLALSVGGLAKSIPTGVTSPGPFKSGTSVLGAGLGAVAAARGALSLALQPLMFTIAPTLAKTFAIALTQPFGILAAAILGKNLDKILNAIFGGKTTQRVKDFGITVEGTINSLSNTATNLTKEYATVETTIKGGLFRRTRVFDKTETQKASDEITEYVSTLFADVKNSFLTAGSLLGKDVSATLEDYVIEPFTISLKDKKPEEIADAVKNQLSIVFNEITKVQFKSLLDALRDPLEEAGTTLTRLISQTQLFSQSMLLLGKNVENITGTLKTVIADDLVKAFGGLEEYENKINFFRENFLTEAERIAPVSQKLTETLKKLGISTALTREQYKALVLQQDLTKTSGRETFTALLSIGEAFDKVTDFAEQAKEKLTGFATTIRNFIKEQTLQIVSPTQGLNYLLREFQTTVEKGLQGDEKSLGYLTEIAGRTIESARNNARSAREFNLLRAGVISSLSNVATEIETGNVKIVTPQEQANIILEQIQQNTSTLPEDLAQVLAKEIDAYIPVTAAPTPIVPPAPVPDVGYSYDYNYSGPPGTNALGAAYYKGMKMFASGGAFTNSVVSNATMFPLGVMGEAGPEAIMPLTRTADGSLGVTADIPFNNSNELNKQLIQEVRELKKEMEKVRMGVEVTATGTNKTFRLLDRVAQNGDSLNVVVTA